MSSLLDKISNAIPISVKNFFSSSRQLIARNSDWLFPWVAGGLAGLIIGLFIGWIAWPVQWTGMQLNDLSQPQKAAYISAVADAYILDGSGYSEVNMYTRLDGFGASLADEVLAAIEYYRADPSVDQVQVANLAGLANDLGIPIDASALDTAANAPALQIVPGGVGDAVAPVTVGEAAASEETGAGIWMWLLALVVAGGLIGGGVYLLRYLSRTGRPSESLTSEPAPTLPGEIRAPQMVATSRNGPKRTSLWKSKPEPVAKNPDDLSFDDEDEDEEPAVRFGGADDDSFGDDDGDPVSTARYSSPGLTSSFNTPQSYTGSSYSGSSYEGSTQGGYGAAVATAPAATAEATHPEPAPVRTAPRRRPENATSAPTLPRKIVASYTCHYLAGIADYIEAHNITDPATGRYIGECGMGVSSKNKVLHNNPNQVIALEVWLYDKLDPRDNLSNTRVLLSEYAADRDFGQAFTKEHDGNVKTFVAQPGTRFQLDGRNLVLEGEILDAEYDREGIFRGVKVVMNVLNK